MGRRRHRSLAAGAALAALVLAAGGLWATVARYELAGEGAEVRVLDRVTGLEWQGAPPGAGVDWPAALAACAGLDLGGDDDWRLPDVTELQSILDETAPASGPPVNATYFSELSDTDAYWTATTHPTATSSALVVHLEAGDSLTGRGGVSGRQKSASALYLCVRGP